MPLLESSLQPSFDVLRDSYLAWIEFLGQDRRYKSDDFAKFYEEKVAAHVHRSALKNSLFDEQLFPSLFDRLPILERGTEIAGINPEGIIWNEHWLDSNLREDDIGRLLLAFIWKQGDYQKVEHVLAGLRGNPLGDRGAVMYQFGRHLANPYENPIFDQHTSRHRLVFMELAKQGEGRMTVDQFGKLFGGRGQIPTTEAVLGNKKYLSHYLRWWRDTVERKLPDLTSKRARGQGVLWSDRIMFTLGKAAKAVQETWKRKQHVKNGELRT